MHSASSNWKWDYNRPATDNFKGPEALFKPSHPEDPKGPRNNYTGVRARHNIVDEAHSSACSAFLTQKDHQLFLDNNNRSSS